MVCENASTVQSASNKYFSSYHTNMKVSMILHIYYLYMKVLPIFGCCHVMAVLFYLCFVTPAGDIFKAKMKMSPAGETK